MAHARVFARSDPQARSGPRRARRLRNPPCPAFGKCIQRDRTYGWYAENLSLLGYSVYDYGQAFTNAVTTARVVYNASSGCWEAYLTYTGQLKSQVLHGEPPTGSMWALLEVLIQSGVSAHVPNYNFGATNPNSNQAMRLFGANGFEPWDDTLLAQTTDEFDERTSVPSYILSDYSRHYFFLAHGP